MTVRVTLFTLPTCAPCQAYKPILKAAVARVHNAVLTEVNAEEHRETAYALGIRSVPFTLVEYPSGLSDKWQGFKSEANLVKILEEDPDDQT